MLYIRYPQGAGGFWLSELSHKILHRDLNYDNEADKINFHSLIGLESGHDARCNDDIVFSGTARFDFFVNFWWKKRVFENYLDFNKLSDFEKLNVLAEESRWILYSPEYDETYCDRIDIDWTWLWNDEQKFKKVLLHILARPHTTDLDDFIDAYIMLYKKSCVDQIYHIGNPFSLPWISWCYAVSVQNDMDLKINVQDDRDLPLISRFVANHNERFVDLTRPYALKRNR